MSVSSSAVMVWPKADWVLATSLAPPADDGIEESAEEDQEAAAGDSAAQYPEKPAHPPVSQTPPETGHSQRQPAGEVPLLAALGFRVWGLGFGTRPQPATTCWGGATARCIKA